MHITYRMSDGEYTRSGEWSLVTANLPTQSKPIGVLLRDIDSDVLGVKLRANWWVGLCEEEEGEIWNDLGEDLVRQSKDFGAGQCLDWLENTASHAFQIGVRQEIRFQNLTAALDGLYRQHVCGEHFASAPDLVVCTEASQSRTTAISRGFLHRTLFKMFSTKAALAIAVIVGAFFAGARYQSSTPQKPAIVRLVQFEPIALPPLPVIAVTNGILESLAWAPTPRVRGPHRSSARIRKPLRVATLPVQPSGALNAKIRLQPPPQLALDLTPAIPVRLPLPPPPQFRAKRNIFVRLGSALAAPFRDGEHQQYHTGFANE
jgi:hypothetical protein